MNFLSSLKPCLRLHLALLGLIFLALPATPQDKTRSGVFTVAVVEDAVYVGRAMPLGARGKFELQGLRKSDGECSGSYQYHRFPLGRARFDCTNGLFGSVKITADESLTGRGRGFLDGKRIDLVYGYSLATTNRLLKFPGDRELKIHEDHIVLVSPK